MIRLCLIGIYQQMLPEFFSATSNRLMDAALQQWSADTSQQ